MDQSTHTSELGAAGLTDSVTNPSHVETLHKEEETEQLPKGTRHTGGTGTNTDCLH